MDFRSSHFEGNGRLAEAAANNPPMKKGEAGRAVRLLQQALIDLGHSLPKSTKKFGSPDGIYGSETKNRVWKFQVNQGLKRDSIAGKETVRRMDKLLADSKIRFRPLPSLPPSSPGNFTIVGLDTEQTILETLWMPTLMTINFELEWKSKITKLRTVSSVRIRGIRYAEIADAVLKGRIGVVIDPAIAQDMIYTYRGTNANSFRARRSMTMALDDMAVIVHEATHAICDLEMIGNLDSIFNEAIAFVAECIFFRKAAGRIRLGGNADQNAVLAYADSIAQKILSGKTRIDAIDNDLVNIETPLGVTPRAKWEKSTRASGSPSERARCRTTVSAPSCRAVLPSRHHPDRPQAETIPVVVSAGLAVQRNDVLLVGLVRH